MANRFGARPRRALAWALVVGPSLPPAAGHAKDPDRQPLELRRLPSRKTDPKRPCSTDPDGHALEVVQ